jgi:hypothetical protein
MKHENPILICLCVLIAGWLLPAYANANLINNASFEAGASGWVFSGGGAGTCPQPCTVPHSGENAAYKNLFDGGMGTISQTVATIPGTSYLVELWLADNSVESGTVTAAFGSVLGVSASDADTSTTYKLYSFTAMATDSLTDFVFGGVVTGGTFFLDDVSVTVVPEPSTYALFLTGLAMLLGLVCRRRTPTST